MATSVDVAVIGCGRIAQVHLEVLAALEGSRLVAVADVDEAAAHAAAERFGARPYRDHRELIENAHPDAVWVCTPPSTHAEISIDALQRGVHVLCEKPFAVDAESAKRMIHAAQRAGRFIAMASKFRFVEDVQESCRLVSDGALGEVVLFELAFCSPTEMSGRWNVRKELSGGGVLVDNGSHAADIVRYLCGPILRVLAREGKRAPEIEVEDTVVVLAETAAGVLARIDLSWIVSKEGEPYISIYGTRGRLSVGWNGSWMRANGDAKSTSFGRGYDKLRAFRAQNEHFLRCVTGQEPPRIDAADSLASVEVVESAYRSIDLGRWVEVGVA